MNLVQFAKAIPGDFYSWGTLCAYPRDPRPYLDILDHVQAMTTPSTMHLLNCACRAMESNETYLEVGTWRGASFIGALCGNSAHGIAIDDDSDTKHNEDERKSADVWRENVAHFGVTDRATYVSASVPEVWQQRNLTGGRPVGVYFFDGDKATPEAAYAGLAGIVPFLAENALILVDDVNTGQIRQAVWSFLRANVERACTIVDIPTPANCWPCFWNGVLGIAWGRQL